MKPLRAGDLKDRITFYKMKESKDKMEQDVLEEEIFKTVWANVKPLRGGEYYEAQKIRPELTYKITCRYLPGITPDMIINSKNRKFEIQSIINIEERNVALEIMATEYIEKEGETDRGVPDYGNGGDYEKPI